MAAFADEIITLFEYVFRLKRLPRTGWLLAGVPDPESVAEHSFGTALLACFLGELVNAGFEDRPLDLPVDISRATRIGLVHDLAESLVTDLPREATDLFGRDVKHAAEGEAMAKILSGVVGGEKYMSLWLEYEEGRTLESQLARDADKLDMVMQARTYAIAGQAGLDEFWMGHRWNFTVSRTLFERLASGREHQ